jgi:hypothetical protein
MLLGRLLNSVVDAPLVVLDPPELPPPHPIRKAPVINTEIESSKRFFIEASR